MEEDEHDWNEERTQCCVALRRGAFPRNSLRTRL